MKHIIQIEVVTPDGEYEYSIPWDKYAGPLPRKGELVHVIDEKRAVTYEGEVMSVRHTVRSMRASRVLNSGTEKRTIYPSSYNSTLIRVHLLRIHEHEL